MIDTSMEYTCAQLQEKLEKNDNIYLVDVREGWEWDLVKIEGSHHHPLSTFSETIDSLTDVKQAIVFICHHGVRSLNATHQLREKSRQNCYSLKGGIDAWAKTIDRTLTVY